MAILQPLYHSGGQFRPDYDRKVFAALIGSEADGTRIEGVIGSPSHTSSGMKVSSAGGLSVSVLPGFCVIADNSSQYFNYPSLYLAGVDTSSYVFTLSGTSSGTRTDLIYAKFDDTPFTVLTASRTGTTVTLTTEFNHNFLVGDTVVVSGLDDVFNGAYTTISGTSLKTIKYTTATSGDITSVTYNANVLRLDTNTAGSAPSSTPVLVIDRSFTRDASSSTGTVTLTTSTAHGFAVGNTIKVTGVGPFFDGVYTTYTGTTGTTITYRKTGNDISTLSSTSSLDNYFAVVRVPFSIRQAQDTTNLPDVTGIPLAEVVIGPTSIISVTDRRKFVSSNGGVQRFDSSAGPSIDSLRPDHAAGKLAYDISTDSFYWSDGTTWNKVAISTHSHDAPARYYGAPNVTAGSTLVKPVSFGYAGPVTITGANYLNQYELVGSSNVSVTAISYSTGVITYTASNTFTAGNPVTITGASSTQYNGTFVVASASSTQFTVSATVTAGTTSTATAYRPMGVAITTVDTCYVVVDHSVNISAASGGVDPQVQFDWKLKLPDGTTVDSWLAFNFPLQVFNNGTDYSQGDIQNYFLNALSTAGNIQSSRGLVITPGTTIVTLCAILTNGVSTDSFTVNDMTMRVIPFYEVTV